jgi:hypothetical protein
MKWQNRILFWFLMILVGIFSVALAYSHSAMAAPPLKTWSFYAPGCLPRHLPDSFGGKVYLSSVDPPEEIQGVYKFDDDLGEWLFWGPGAPGCTLEYLRGGMFADYMVCTVGPCDWEIAP